MLAELFYLQQCIYCLPGVLIKLRRSFWLARVIVNYNDLNYLSVFLLDVLRALFE